VSTYYYIACEDEKVSLDEMVAVNRLSGSYLESPKELLDFLFRHQYCNLRFFSEHDEVRCAYKSEEKNE
jgi:hypothetical protein